MTDSASRRLSHSSSIQGRPLQSPIGPRSRFPRSALSPSPVSPRDSFLGSPIEDPAPMYPMSPAQSDVALPAILEHTPPSSSSPTIPVSSVQHTFKVIPKPAKLIPAPNISFDSVPVGYKGLPLEAFLWTLNNHELQEMVSRAIRSSARESFIRLLSLENLDHALPAEIERLTSLKAVTQSKYRFLVHRRTMLLQALNSSTVAPEKRPQEDGMTVVSKLALQLSQTAAECDQVLEVLLRINDQLAQITKMIDVHWASALSIALRKLNKSYARRTSELLSAKERIEQLEAAQEDAWREAAQIAKEMDALDAEVDMDSDGELEDAMIETAEKIKVPPSRRASTLNDLMQSKKSAAQLDALPVFSPLSPMPRLSTIPSPNTADLFRTEDPEPMTPPQQDFTDTTSVHSVRSRTRSMRSIRSGKSMRSTRTSENLTRLSLISAAKTRSYRVSKGSLRLPKFQTLVHQPPVPDLPLGVLATPLPPSSQLSSQQYSWLDMGPTSLMSPPTSSSRIRRTSLDGIRPRRRSASSHVPIVTMDDIYIRPHNWQVSDEIQVVPRTPPPPPPQPSKQPSQTIPSMWLITDPATKPVERSKPIKRANSSSYQTYHKIKSLTKRYSLPFPLFKNKSYETQSASSSKSLPGYS